MRKINRCFYLMYLCVGLKRSFLDQKNSILNIFAFLNLILRRSLQFVVSLWLLDYIALSPSIINWPTATFSSSLVSDINKTSTLPLATSTKNSNLFLEELIFESAITILLECFLHKTLSLLWKETLWETELDSSISEKDLS